MTTITPTKWQFNMMSNFMARTTTTVIDFVDNMLKAWVWNSIQNKEESVTPSLLASIDKSIKSMRNQFGWEMPLINRKLMAAFNNVHQDIIKECDETSSMPHMTPEFKDALFASLKGEIKTSYNVSAATTIKKSLVKKNDYSGWEDTLKEWGNGETSWLGADEWFVSTLEDIIEKSLYDEAYLITMTADYYYGENVYKFDGSILKERIEDMIDMFSGRTPVERKERSRNMSV